MYVSDCIYPVISIIYPTHQYSTSSHRFSLLSVFQFLASVGTIINIRGYRTPPLHTLSHPLLYTLHLHELLQLLY